MPKHGAPTSPITHITGVYAGAGAAAPYRRRAHAVRDAQVLLWEGEQLVFLKLKTCVCHVHVHAVISTPWYSKLVLTKYIEPQPY
jgi:hypothetical protein